MLTSTEESGLRDVLNDLTDSDIFSLAGTVTKGLVNVTDINRQVAVETILSSLEKPSDLLRRQKVTKKILFSYLLKIKSFVSPESTKSDLVNMCLREWRSIEECRHSDYENNSNVSEVQPNSFDWLSSMGTQFAMWFFPMYNALQDFGPEHFWADCKLMGELKTDKERKEAAVIGANEVVTFLRSLIVYDGFYFDANTIGDSVVSEQDPHGLIRILVSGVIHKMSNCIGLFDCFFGLVRNPSYNDNWKIKWIQLKLHVNSCNPGSLEHSTQLHRICQRV